jgi:hypothetical protein
MKKFLLTLPILISVLASLMVPMALYAAGWCFLDQTNANTVVAGQIRCFSTQSECQNTASGFGKQCGFSNEAVTSSQQTPPSSSTGTFAPASGGTGSSANNSFKPIVPLPPNLIQTSGMTLAGYLNAMFRISIMVGSGLAVIMVVMGGFQYILGEAISAKAKGRERIQGALVGLVLLLASYLILYVINPQILNLDILNSGINNPGGSSPGGASSATSPLPINDIPIPDVGGEIAGQGLPDVNIEPIRIVSEKDTTTLVNGAPVKFFGLNNPECSPVEDNGIRYVTQEQGAGIDLYRCTEGDPAKQATVRACCAYTIDFRDIQKARDAGIIRGDIPSNPATPDVTAVCASNACVLGFNISYCPRYAVTQEKLYEKDPVSGTAYNCGAAAQGFACCRYVLVY